MSKNGIFDRTNVKVSGRIRWSTLSKLGRAPAMRLTVLIPLLGIFLLFNEQTEKIFTYPEFFREDLGLASQNNFSTSNLYFTYFGLCFLGFASALFAVFCPKEVAEQPNQQNYLLNSTSRETPVIAKGNLRALLNIHFANEYDDERPENPDYPAELEGDFHALMEEMYSEYNVDNIADDDDLFPEVMTATGYLDFTEFARMLWSNPKVVWAYTIPFFALAPTFAKDIAFLKYQALDHTRYLTRLAISCTYVIGFSLLLVPTLKVFFLLGFTALFKLF